MLSASERARLIGIARHAIEARLRGGEPPAAAELSQPMLRRSGVFVTLRRRADHSLRGCIGYVEPSMPLHVAVARAAVAAATEDGRFERVALDELAELVLDVSVLTPESPIRAEEVVVGRHGLIVERGRQRGLLLPQVPVEQAWDRETFLAQTCRKAGLPKDAWRDPATKLLGFEAEVFGET